MKNGLEHYQRLILDTVGFETGYSSGETWIGYFERKTEFSLEMAQEAILFFLNFFDDDIKDFVVVTSFYIDKDSLIETEDIGIEYELCKSNYIECINGNKYFSEDQKFYDEQLSQLELSFRAFRAEKEIVRKMSLLAMIDSNVQGHCFFVSEKHDLIIYPHSDDTGYGCIGLTSKDNEVGIKFLQEAKKHGFDAYLDNKGHVKYEN